MAQEAQTLWERAHTLMGLPQCSPATKLQEHFHTLYSHAKAKAEALAKEYSENSSQLCKDDRNQLYAKLCAAQNHAQDWRDFDSRLRGIKSADSFMNGDTETSKQRAWEFITQFYFRGRTTRLYFKIARHDGAKRAAEELAEQAFKLVNARWAVRLACNLPDDAEHQGLDVVNYLRRLLARGAT